MFYILLVLWGIILCGAFSWYVPIFEKEPELTGREKIGILIICLLGFCLSWFFKDKLEFLMTAYKLTAFYWFVFGRFIAKLTGETSGLFILVRIIVLPPIIGATVFLGLLFFFMPLMIVLMPFAYLVRGLGVGLSKSSWGNKVKI